MSATTEPTSVPYASTTVPVDGGELTVGVWGEGGPLVVLVHGITSHHRAWAAVGPRLGVDHLVVAMDLRGRGRSRDLPGPYGMARHAADVAAVIDGYGGRAILVGHSMGGFVAMETARRYPERVERMVLVDGGAPFRLPPGVDPDAENPIAEAIAATLGPAFARLRMTFPDRQSYRELWRQHPALAGGGEAIDAYADYDLFGAEPELRAACRMEAALRDAEDLYARPGMLPEPPPVPTRFLRAEFGMLGDPPGLYGPGEAGKWLTGVTEGTVTGVNHYTITLGETGARAIEAAVRAG